MLKSNSSEGMLKSNNFIQDNGSDNMMADVRVLHTLMENRMLSDLASCDVVGEDSRWLIGLGEVDLRVGVPLEWLQFNEQMVMRDNFQSGSSKSIVFYFTRRQTWLAERRHPRDSSTRQENNEADT